MLKPQIGSGCILNFKFKVLNNEIIKHALMLPLINATFLHTVVAIVSVGVVG